MNISKKLMLASLLAALTVTVAAPLSSAYARQGADDSAKHKAADQRGGHGKDDPAGHR
jgi:hypothetical protein